jgi:hypothetical protein
MNKLKGKVAIVTGASKGIGAALAKGLAEAGDHTDTEGTRRIGYVGSELAQQIVLETPLGGRFWTPGRGGSGRGVPCLGRRGLADGRAYKCLGRSALETCKSSGVRSARGESKKQFKEVKSGRIGPSCQSAPIS